MSGPDFDALTKSLATTTSRRGMLKGLLGTLAGVLTGLVSRAPTAVSAACSCPAGQTCVSSGRCCPTNRVCTKPDGSTICCAVNTACVTNGTCCPTGRVCQKPDGTTTCCAADRTCISNGTCCPTGQVCHKPDGTTTCCAADRTCISNGTCCPTGRVCQKPDGTTICCAVGTTCVTNGTCCPTGRACTKPDGTSVCCRADKVCGANGCVCPAGTVDCQGACRACCTNAQCADGNPCTEDVCDLTTFTCTHQPLSNGSACPDDGNACTSDVCVDGACEHPPVSCLAPGPCQEEGICNPATGECEYADKPDGTLCGAESDCTHDICLAGECVVGQPKSDGTACDDDDACTQTDTCQAGVCVGGNPVVCTASDQCHGVGTCDPATGLCSDPAKPDGEPCDDGNECTQADTCQSGICVGGNPVVCAASDQCHDPGVCDPATGVCSDPAKPDGEPCDDGDLCTQDDTCQGGTCTGGDPVICIASDQCHDAGVCDPATGQCSNPAKPNGFPCSDSNACTGTDTCQEGVCTPGTDVVCPPPEPCKQAGICNPETGQCEYDDAPDGTPCDDGNECTQTDTCQAGVCVGGNPVVCVASDQCHDVGTCDPVTGLCSNPAKPDGEPCNDGDACTQTDICQGGICVGGDPVICTASDQCHDAGICDPATAVCSNPAKPDGEPCDDGDACTQTDTCLAGVCVGGDPVVCTASDQCHDVGVCDPTTGLCSNPAKPDGEPCDDGDACTQVDTCQQGICVGGDPVICTASDQCHDAGVCDPASGLCSNPAKPDGEPCDDEDACTVNDTCQAGACTPGTPVTCEPSADPCLVNVCNSESGICEVQPAADNTPCEDGDLCTVGDTCQAGICTAGSAVTCDPSADPCLVNVCNSSTGVCEAQPAPDGTVCDDGNACTTGDSCLAGQCQPGTPTTCTQPANQCQQSICNSTSGQCEVVAKPNGTTCSDGNVCTTNDVCVNGACIGTAVVCTSPQICCTSGGAAGTCKLPSGASCSGNGNCCSGSCTGSPKRCA